MTRREKFESLMYARGWSIKQESQSERYDDGWVETAWIAFNAGCDFVCDFVRDSAPAAIEAPPQPDYVSFDAPSVCKAVAPEGFVCTLLKGHHGQHEAHGIDKVWSRWESGGSTQGGPGK